MRKRTRFLRGVTLTEALLFLGLAAIAIVGAFALYNNASGNSTMNEARVQLQAYIGNVRSLYATQNDYGSLDTSLVINAGLAPKQAVDGNVLVNPWGGDTVIDGQTRTFTVTFEDVPDDACVALMSSGLLNNGTVIAMRVNSGTSYAQEITPDVAVGACNGGGTNDVMFTSR